MKIQTKISKDDFQELADMFIELHDLAIRFGEIFSNLKVINFPPVEMVSSVPSEAVQRAVEPKAPVLASEKRRGRPHPSCGTKKELAEIIGIYPQCLSRIFDGPGNASLKTAQKLAKITGTEAVLWLKSGFTADRQAAFGAWSEARQSGGSIVVAPIEPPSVPPEGDDFADASKMVEREKVLPKTIKPGSQGHLATILNLHQTTISCFVNSKRSTCDATAQKLAVILDTEPKIWQSPGYSYLRREAFNKWSKKQSNAQKKADVDSARKAKTQGAATDYGYCERMRAKITLADCQSYRQPNDLSGRKAWRNNDRCQGCAGLNMEGL